MPIELSCPACSQKYRLKDSLAGKKAKCAKCGERIHIPTPAPLGEEPHPDLSGLFDDTFPGTEQTLLPESATDSSACPECGMTREQGAVVCITCGYNYRSGEKLTTHRSSIASQSTISKAGFAASLGKGTLFSFGGAMVGAGIWVGIAVTTG